MVAANYNIQENLKQANEVIDKVGVRGAYQGLANTGINTYQLNALRFHTDRLLSVGYGKETIADMLQQYTLKATDKNGRQFVNFQPFYQKAAQAFDFQKQRVADYETQQAEASIDGTVDSAYDSQTAKEGVIPFPSMKKAKKIGTIAAGIVGAVLVANVVATPIYEADTTFIQDNGNGTYLWRTDILNVSAGNESDDSGISAVLYTGDTSNHSFGGDVGTFWQLVSAGALDFSAEAWDGEGFIDPSGLDPTTDMLSILYNSPFDQLGDSKIDIETYGNGVYTIEDVQLPVPEPATLAVLLAGLPFLRKRK